MKNLTRLWCPRCPVCHGAGLRDPSLQMFDCECLHCGHYYTSPLKGCVLKVTADSARRAEQRDRERDPWR
jgi:hypothetical protein